MNMQLLKQVFLGESHFLSPLVGIEGNTTPLKTPA